MEDKKLEKKNNIIEIVNCHIASIIILINSLQFVLKINCNIEFNMGIIEYILLGIAIIINNGKIKNIKNIYILLITILIFLFNIAIDSNETLIGYLKGFILIGAPIFLVFSLNIKLELFTKIFAYYNVFCALMQAVANFVQPTIISENYMTFGYFSIFSVSYIILYGHYYKRTKLLLLGIVLLPITFIYGNKGTILIVGVLTILVLLLSNKYHKVMKFIAIIIVIIACLWGTELIKGTLDFVTDKFEINTYSINTIYRLLESKDSEELLGGRYYIYEETIAEIKENLITGMGIGKFENIYGYFPHNIFLEVYVTFGIIGGTIYILMLLYLGMKMYKCSKDDINAKILFIFCVSNIMKLMISKSFIVDQTSWLYIIIAIFIIKNRKIGSEDKIENNSIYTNLQ